MNPHHRRVLEAKDWQQLRERLARACASLAEGERLSPERARAILEERARLLARTPPQAAATAAFTEVMIFALDNERYAIETSYIREVLPLGEVTPVPGTPDFLIGITNLRGQILPLFDLSKLLGLAEHDASDLSRVIVLGEERAEFGVLADAVFEVVRLRIEEVLEPPGSVAGIAREFVRGVTEDALLLLDGAVLLNDRRLFVEHGDDSRGSTM